MKWQIEDAKSHLEQLIEQTHEKGPQWIRINGEDAVVVLSAEDYQRLSLHQENLAEFLLRSPLRNSGFELSHHEEIGRSRKR